MAATPQTLGLAEFEAHYGHQKPYYEFWYGQAIQKSMPTWIHGLLQRIIMDLFVAAGYEAASEVRLNIEPNFNPVPDVIATRGEIEDPYPTRPLEVVVEILSENDPMSRLLTKFRTYDTWGFEQIYLIDPANRLALRWLNHRLEEVTLLADQPVSQLWTTLDRALSRKTTKLS